MGLCQQCLIKKHGKDVPELNEGKLAYTLLNECCPVTYPIPASAKNALIFLCCDCDYVAVDHNGYPQNVCIG